MGLVEENRIKSSVRANLSIIADLHRKAFGFIPSPLSRMLDLWGADANERGRFNKKMSGAPYNFSPLLFWRALIEKLSDFRALCSLGAQIAKMAASPKFFADVVASAWNRTFRDDMYLHK